MTSIKSWYDWQIPAVGKLILLVDFFILLIIIIWIIDYLKGSILLRKKFAQMDNKERAIKESQGLIECFKKKVLFEKIDMMKISILEIFKSFHTGQNLVNSKMLKNNLKKFKIRIIKQKNSLIFYCVFSILFLVLGAIFYLRHIIKWVEKGDYSLKVVLILIEGYFFPVIISTVIVIIIASFQIMNLRKLEPWIEMEINSVAQKLYETDEVNP